MKVLFVCTGNICRSPMGELMFPLFFHSDAIETDSAGVNGLIGHHIDPSSNKLMEIDGIDASAFRSKRITPQLVLSSDLVLCFTDAQRGNIVALAPRARSRTYTVSDFANLCRYCTENGLISGDTIEDRVDSVIADASMVRPMLPAPQDIQDPYHKEFEMFQDAHDQMGHAFADIARALEPSRASHAA